jgi:hypothetical protein
LLLLPRTELDTIDMAAYATYGSHVLVLARHRNGSNRWRAKSAIDAAGETLANFAR